MNTLQEIKRFVIDKSHLSADHDSRPGWSMIALIMGLMLTLAVGSFFLFSYPLQTAIVILFMASIFFLDRA